MIGNPVSGLQVAPAVPGVKPAVPVLLRLTSLRALAALGVFSFHLVRWDVLAFEPARIGYVGVSFFFVLSGFVLAWSTVTDAAAGPFYWRRIARVYPLYLVCLIASLLVPVTAYPVTLEGAIASVVLLQAWSPNEEVAFALNGVSWSLSCEAAFYLAMPFLLRLLGPRHSAWRWTFALILSTVLSAVVLVLAEVGGHAATAAFTNPILRSGEFVLGLVAALAVKDGWRLRLPLAALVAGVSAATTALLLPFPSGDVTLAPSFLVVIVLAAQYDLQGRRGLLTTRAGVYAGEVSYAFYLVHEMVILNLKAVPGLAGAALSVVALVLSCVFAVLLHHAVERPARRVLLARRRSVQRRAG